MGKHNRQRRADRRRAARKRQSTPGAGARRDTQGTREGRSAPSLETLVIAAAHASARGLRDDAELCVARLVQRGDDDRDGWPALSRVLAQLLVGAVAERWRLGWQPADLVHVVGRELRTVHRHVCAEAIELDAATYRHAPGADPAWLAQVEAVTDGAGQPDDPDSGDASLFGRLDQAEEPLLLDRLVPRAGGVHDALQAVIETLGLFQRLPSQPRLCPPPSEWGRTTRTRPRPTGRAPDPKVTDRVRALLAKAESTTFPDEAEAFTAKAQELIARHAIDLAMLEGEQPSADVVGRRILIDDPYGRAKSVLVSVVARVNRCSAVFNEGLGFSTLFGGPNDLDAVELLYTSLLTQATAAMAAAGRSGGARSRGRSFRQSFLLSFAYRIGERLEEATATAVDDARAVHGDNVLPVLASRDAASEEARDAAFPQLRGQRIAMNSREGWAAGRAAADLARLGPDAELRAG
jgi:hypothetical protein